MEKKDTSSTTPPLKSDNNKEGTTTSSVKSDNSMEGTEDTTSSSYNGEDSQKLRDRSDHLQNRAVNIEVNKQNLETFKELASKKDEKPESLTTNERINLENLKLSIFNFDNNKSFTDNLNREINELERISSDLNTKSLDKLNKANSLEPLSPEKGSDAPEDNTSNDSLSSDEKLSSKPEDNLSPTQYVHELESISPMEIIPDDD